MLKTSHQSSTLLQVGDVEYVRLKPPAEAGASQVHGWVMEYGDKIKVSAPPNAKPEDVERVFESVVRCAQLLEPPKPQKKRNCIIL